MATQDWPFLSRYLSHNEKLSRSGNTPHIVFIGDSIIEQWTPLFTAHFPTIHCIGRGIGGQTSPQVLLRFTQDALALAPSKIVILVGTNDIAGNTGPSTISMIEDNIHAMSTLAIARDIGVVLCSVLPASSYPWAPSIRPAEKIVSLNTHLIGIAEELNIGYADFYTAMVNNVGGLSAELAEDGVHPTPLGYEIMADILRPHLV